MKRKRKTSLPRVTLLAYSRKDLLAFAESVEALRLLVDDLRIVAMQLQSAATAKGKKPATRSSPATSGPATSPPTSAAPGKDGAP